MPVLSIRIDEPTKLELEQRAEVAGLNQSDYVKLALEKFMASTPFPTEARTTLRLSKLERLILTNQYRLLAILDEDSAADSKTTITALMNGYEFNYSWAIDNFSDGLSQEECKFVRDVLSMYRDLKFSSLALGFKDEKMEGEFDFPGFDGNEEGEYRGYVNYFIYDLNRYDELRATNFEKSFNSHKKMIDTYRLMLPVWEKIRQSNFVRNRDHLSLEQMRAIVDAPPWKKMRD